MECSGFNSLKGAKMKNNKIKIEMEIDTKGMGMEIGQLIMMAIQMNKSKKVKIKIYSELPLDYIANSSILPTSILPILPKNNEDDPNDLEKPMGVFELKSVRD